MTAPNRVLSVASIFTVGVLLLSACGGSEEAPERALPGPVASADPDASPEGPTTSATTATVKGGFGTYTFESPEGIKGTLIIPTKATDPAVREYESYRKLAHAPKATYVLATVDNQSTDTSVNMYQVVVVTDDGEQVIFESAGTRVSEWMNAFGYENQDEVRKYNIGVDLSNKTVENLRPGAKGERVMAVEGTLASVARVFVYPAGGFTEVAAVKAD